MIPRLSVRVLDIGSDGRLTVWRTTPQALEQYGSSDEAHEHAKALAYETQRSHAVFVGRKKLRDYAPGDT